MVSGFILGALVIIGIWVSYNVGYTHGEQDAQDECDEHEMIGQQIFGDNNEELTEYPNGPIVSET